MVLGVRFSINNDESKKKEKQKAKQTPPSSSCLCPACYLGALSFRDKHLMRGGAFYKVT